VQSISGQVGKNTIFENWRAGVNIAKAYNAPPNTPTTKQNIRRGLFRSAVAIWNGLSAAAKLNWNNYAAEHPYNTNQTDGGGILSIAHVANTPISGYTAFIQVNMFLGGIGFGMLSAPPIAAQQKENPPHAPEGIGVIITHPGTPPVLVTVAWLPVPGLNDNKVVLIVSATSAWHKQVVTAVDYNSQNISFFALTGLAGVTNPIIAGALFYGQLYCINKYGVIAPPSQTFVIAVT
jgi:hypothetical protein